MNEKLITDYDKSTVKRYMSLYGPGWCQYYEILYDLVIKYGTENEYIIEIGCWEAGSTLALAFASQYKGLTKPIISIDIRGRINMLLTEFVRTVRFDEQVTIMLAEHHIAMSGIGEKIVSIVTKSDWAIDFLRDKKACVVLIDGLHGFGPTGNDIINYGSLLIPGGVIVCHDYGQIEVGCTKAINQFVRDSLLYTDFIFDEMTAWAKKYDESIQQIYQKTE